MTAYLLICQTNIMFLMAIFHCLTVGSFCRYAAMDLSISFCFSSVMLSFLCLAPSHTFFCEMNTYLLHWSILVQILFPNSCKIIIFFFLIGLPDYHTGAYQNVRMCGSRLRKEVGSCKPNSDQLSQQLEK